MKLYGYKNRWGDLLEIHRPSSRSGLAFYITSPEDAGLTVLLDDPDAHAMLKTLADALGYHLVVKSGECRRESVTPEGDELIIDCELHGEIGRLPAGVLEGEDEYVRIEAFFAQHQAMQGGERS